MLHSCFLASSQCVPGFLAFKRAPTGGTLLKFLAFSSGTHCFLAFSCPNYTFFHRRRDHVCFQPWFEERSQDEDSGPDQLWPLQYGKEKQPETLGCSTTAAR